MTVLRTALRRVWYPEMPAQRLAALRILVGLYGLVYLLSRMGAFIGVTRYAPSQFRPVGPVAICSAPLPAAVVIGLVAATVIVGVAFVLGWRFRVLGPLYGLGMLWCTSYRNSWGMVFHTENLLVLQTVVLSLAASADAWSFDARGRKLPADSGRYGWAVQLLCMVTVLAYFIAGYAKLAHAGIDWVTSDTLRNFIAYDNVRKVELGAGYSWLGTKVVTLEWLFPPFAAISLALELGSPLALLSRRWGQVWALSMWGFHLGVLLLMYILFHYQLVGVAFAAFFGVERVGRWIERRVGRVGTV